MASLEGQTIASTYKQLLKITSEGVGADASGKYIEDGLGTDTALSLSTTRVGIGTASPAEMLEVYNATSPAIQLNDGGDYQAIMRLAGNDLEIRGSGGKLELYNGANDGDSSTLAMTIDSSQRVGIGIASPSSYHSSTQLAVGNTSGEGQITIVSGSSNDANINFADGTTGTATAEGIIRYKHSNNQMELYTGQALAMAINSSGDVGIGDTAPSTALTSFGSASKGLSIKNVQPTIALTDTDTGSGHFWIANGGGISYFQNTVSGATMRFYVESIQALTIENDGVLKSTDGIEFTGTALDSGQTGVASSGSGGDLRIYTNGTQSTTFKSDGNVLIGTTDNDARLMVKKVDGTSYGQFVTIEGDTTDNNNYSGISFKAGTLANAYPEIGVSNGGLMYQISGGYHSSNYNNRTKIQLNGSDGHISFQTGGDPADEKMKLDQNGNLIMQVKSNGLANNIKFAGSATYANSAFTVHSTGASGAIVLITNHSNDSSGLFHMDYDHSTITMISNPGGVDSDGFNNADSGDTIRVFKSAGTFNFTVKNSTGTSKNIGIGIISMHSS